MLLRAWHRTASRPFLFGHRLRALSGHVRGVGGGGGGPLCPLHRGGGGCDHLSSHHRLRRKHPESASLREPRCCISQHLLRWVRRWRHRHLPGNPMATFGSLAAQQLRRTELRYHSPLDRGALVWARGPLRSSGIVSITTPVTRFALPLVRASDSARALDTDAQNCWRSNPPGREALVNRTRPFK